MTGLGPYVTDRRLLLLVTGTRRNGNSEALAARAAEALPDSHFRGEMNG